MVTAALEEIAPQDAENLWNSLVKSKTAMQQFSTEEEEKGSLDALAECYNNANHWSTRRQILSIIADKVILKRCKGGSPALHGTDLTSQGTIVFFMAEALW